MSAPLITDAIVIEQPGRLTRRSVSIAAPTAGDVVVSVQSCGISTGTERLLWDGTMPVFPGLSYPLVPGYEAVGTVVDAGDGVALAAGARVFVPGAAGYQDGLTGLFGANAATLVVPESRVTAVDGIEELADERATLLALAATAMHALSADARRRGEPVTLAGLASGAPDLIVGHGVLGRLLARIVVAIGADAPTVHETNAGRRDGVNGYACVDPAGDESSRYRCIVDVSGAGGDHLDRLIARLARKGQLVLAGFYHEPIRFEFAPAFMREINVAIAAEWVPDDLRLVLELLQGGALTLTGLISHRAAAADADTAYPEAFRDATRLKTVLDWNP